uniref:BTB domain-containing protein n=1 Tax=Strigamia maritima TaxID=126957 RepID=T1J5U6_STRMM
MKCFADLKYSNMNELIIYTLLWFAHVHQIDMSNSQHQVPAAVKADLDNMNGYNNFKMSSAVELDLHFYDPMRECETFIDGVSKRYVQRTLKEGRRSKLSLSDITSARDDLKDVIQDMRDNAKLGRASTTQKERKKVTDQFVKRKLGNVKKAAISKLKFGPSADFTFELVTDEHRLLIDKTGKQPPKVFGVTNLNAYFEGEYFGTLKGEVGLANENYKFLYDASDLTASISLHKSSPSHCVYARETICVGRPVINACNRHDIDNILKEDDFKCKEFGANQHYHKHGFKRDFDISDLFDSGVEPIVLQSTNQNGEENIPVSNQKRKERIPVSNQNREERIPVSNQNGKETVNVHIPVWFHVDPPASFSRGIISSASIPMSEVVPNFILLDEIVDEDEKSGMYYPAETDLNLKLNFKDTVYDFPVHRLVIYARSGDFLYYLVENSSKPAINQSAEIDLDIDPEIFQEILHFIYQNKIQHPRNCKNLLVPSLQLEVYTLFEKCLKIIKDNMTLRNANEYLQLAEMHNIVFLRSVVMEFLQNNAQEMTSSEFKNLLYGLPELQLIDH